jgi:hypothetical protein
MTQLYNVCWVCIFTLDSHFEPKSTAELVNHFDENLQAARDALRNASNEVLAEPFYLKNQGQVCRKQRQGNN